jgi:hypothetical protein
MIGPEGLQCSLAGQYPVFGGNIKFLVESECESLFLVDCHGIGNRAADKDVRFDVFRLDEKEKKWIKVDHFRGYGFIFGGRLFLCCFSF